jgi:dihydroflavonol-4-reductase
VLGIRALGDIADEDTKHAGRFGSAYEETKWQAHQKVAEAAASGMPVVTVMPGGPYGPGDPSILGTMIRYYARGWLVVCPYLETEFSLMHVEDLADGIIGAHDKGRVGQEYILGGENGALRDLFKRLEPLTGIRAPRLGLPDWAVKAATPLSPLVGRIMKQGPRILKDAAGSMGGSFMASSAKAQKELGYVYRSLEDALPPVVESYKES